MAMRFLLFNSQENNLKNSRQAGAESFFCKFHEITLGNFNPIRWPPYNPYYHILN